MHRSHSIVLVILAALAACSKHDESEGLQTLSQDRTLVAGLATNHAARPMPLPAACGTIAAAGPAAAANQEQAEELDRRADVAAIAGNVEEARALLHRASELDATNKSVAYHLARANETVGDRAGAMKAYCRYLSLTPTTAESAEARQRVAELSRVETRSQPSSRVVVSAPVRHRSTRSTRMALRAPEPRMQGAPAIVTREVAQTRESAGGDVEAASPPTPTVSSPATPSRTERRGVSTAQSSIIGAAAGAILGAATGRSVKSAVIGAAAGGVLGTVVGRQARPAGRLRS